MRTVALLVNRDKPEAREVKERLLALLESSGLHTICSFTDEVAVESDSELERFRFVEMAFVLGGDGTLLGVARRFAPLGIPLLGINVGHLGFLTEAEPSTLEETVRRVVDHDYDIEPRLMLDATVFRGNEKLSHLTGLNDAGIGKGSFARMVTIDVFVNDVYLDTYSGDGVIVSSPTGSTAYSLSCGGPIVSPHLKVLLITPICSHTLFARPTVIDENQEVRLVVNATHEDLGLTLDGQVGVRLLPRDVVVVRKSAVQAKLVKWRDREFFAVLRQKLHDFDVPLADGSK